MTEELCVQVTVFAVGIGLKIYENELTTIASEPKCNHVYFLAAFSDITSFTSQIMNDACKGNNSGLVGGTADFTYFI